MSEVPLDRLRAICLALPETSERLGHGEPTRRVREKRAFACYSDHHHNDRVAFWLAAPPVAQDVLLASAPSRYFRPPYVARHGWVGAWLDVPVDWEEIASLVAEAPAHAVSRLGHRRSQLRADAPGGSRTAREIP